MNNTDKRTVHTDALASLGTLELGNDADRDAIHLAVLPVTCDVHVYPGMRVGYSNGKAQPTALKTVGIVDPFLSSPVPPNTKFWLIVYPRTITSLRHVWEHPDFVTTSVPSKIETEFDKSQRWLMNFAEEIDETYEHVMSVADTHQGDGYPDYISQGGRFEGEVTPSEFWDHYAVVRNNPNPKRESFFSCSC